MHEHLRQLDPKRVKDAGLPAGIQMTRARHIVKSLLPQRVRHFLRASYRDVVFRRAMRVFLEAPEACTEPANTVVADLIYGWGNESWSASAEYISGCIQHALNSNGPILECGSGLSTLLVGAVAKRRGLSHWALEHQPEWASKARKHLERYQITSVVVCTEPLTDYGEFSWYKPPLESMPDSFSLVICDGPPGDTAGGRFGLVPIMRERLRPGCVILLDDAAREQELAIARRWEVELGAAFQILGRAEPYIEMTVMGPGWRSDSPKHA